MVNGTQLSRIPLHPRETRASVLLARARDILRGLVEDAADDTTIRDLEYEIDTYLTDVAQGKR